MATTVKGLSEERVGLHEKMKTILDAADTDGRNLTAEERQEYDAMEDDLDTKGDEIETLEGDRKRRERLVEYETELSKPKGRRTVPLGAGEDDGGDGATLEGASFRESLQNDMVADHGRREAVKRFVKRSAERPVTQRMEGFRDYIVGGWPAVNPDYRAALEVGSDAAGGSMVVPEEFLARLIKGVDDRVYIRQISTVLPLTSAESIGVPSLENDPADADWTSELAIGNEDHTMSTGKRKLHPHPLAKLMKVSKTLLRRSAIPVDSLVNDRLVYKFGVTEENAFLTADGVDKPLGVFTASANGISTGRDVATDNTGTAVTADGLINAKFALKAPYQSSSNLRWIFHRTLIRDIRKLKYVVSGEYVWAAGLAGHPDTILEVPYLMSEFAPNTMTVNQYVGIIGDFTWYWIAESMRMELERLNELYAATNQVGYIGRMELDAMPVLEEAFARVQLAAA